MQMVRYVGIRRNAGVFYLVRRLLKLIFRRRLTIILLAIAALLCLCYVGSNFVGHLRDRVVGRSVGVAVKARSSFADLLHIGSKVSAEIKDVDLHDCDGRISILAEENASLKKVLNFLSDHTGMVYLTTRAVVIHNGAQWKVLLPVGKRHGIIAHQAVVDGRGLVGKIVDVKDSFSVVQLVTDKDFSMPVTVAENGLSATLTWSKKGPILADVSSNQNTNIDATSCSGIVITAYDREKKTPSGIHVGYAEGNKVSVTLDLKRLDIVSVVRTK